MSRGNLAVTKRYCGVCKRMAKLERNAIEWGLGDFVMVLVTFLMWLPLKFAFNAWTNPWRCSTCGAKPMEPSK